jgi:hypothetical protein
MRAALQITCLYDANQQTAGNQGHHGVPLRPPPKKSIGPVAFIFRCLAPSACSPAAAGAQQQHWDALQHGLHA